MEQNLENLLKDLALEQLMKSPLGDQLQHAMHIFDKVQTHYFALAEKQDEMGMTGIKAVTVLTFAILRKIADPKLFLSMSVKEKRINIFGRRKYLFFLYAYCFCQ